MATLLSQDLGVHTRTLTYILTSLQPTMAMATKAALNRQTTSSQQLVNQ